MEIINLALKTGYSFKKIVGDLETTLNYSVEDFVGVADIGNSYAHAGLEKVCNERDIIPIYGVRLTVVKNATEQIKPRGSFGSEYIFIAKNNSGLKEIYSLIKTSTENFYYRANISGYDVDDLSENVYVIATSNIVSKRVDYISLSPSTPKKILLDYSHIEKVAMVDNFYPNAEDKSVYELFTSPKNTNNKTYPQHILSTKEWKVFIKRKFNISEKDIEKSIVETHIIANCCEVVLEKAPMIKYIGKEKIEFLCRIGAKKRGLDINNDGEYKDRYLREISVIKKQNFQDYFLVVWDIVKRAKKKMFVGAGRGSAAGSLVCYLLEITEVDPIPYGLLFERFVDVNRSDLPDIDIDFPDNKRESVIKDLIKMYGEEKVKHISIVSTMQPKVAINEWAKGLRIPVFETEELKSDLIERSEGDERSDKCLLDTFETVETGKDFIEEFPQMLSVQKIEGHPRHHGVHAAGVIVCNDNIEKYSGVSVRDNTVHVDKHEAEYLNLLKIDILGLRTLSVLADACNQVDMDFRDFYSLELNDEKTFSIFNEMRLSGIFQFEGHAVGGLAKKMGVNSFNDIVAITALGRPAALQSGGANKYIKCRTGEELPVYAGEIHEKISSETFGIIVFQEQTLNLCREVGNMSWKDVNAVRKALSKSKGEEFFSQYKESFLKGANENCVSKSNAEYLWDQIAFSGSYAFNKSHSVAYGMISFWCAWMKAHYPLEFLVANLNNSRDTKSAIKILRDGVKNEGIEYVPIDPDESEIKWSVKNGIVVGGLLNLDGVGVNKAKKIIENRLAKKSNTPSINSKLMNPKTDFDILFPTKHYWDDIFQRPEVYGLEKVPDLIKDIEGKKDDYLFIGRLSLKSLKDLNEYASLAKRNGEVYTDNNLQLTITVEDDTDSIMVFIDRFKFVDLGLPIVDHGIVDESWYIIKGKIIFDSRFVFAEDINELDESMLEKK
jgi:DNA polymerase III alpha subunit